MSSIEGNTQSITPWTKDIKQVIARRFEIVGIPLHPWNDLTIYKIGNTIGVVKEVHNMKYSYDYDTAELITVSDDRRILQKSLRLNEDSHVYNIRIQEIKVRECQEEEQTSESEFELIEPVNTVQPQSDEEMISMDKHGEIE